MRAQRDAHAARGVPRRQHGGHLTLLDGSADVDAKSDGEGVGAPLHAGHGTTEARERADARRDAAVQGMI